MLKKNPPRKTTTRCNPLLSFFRAFSFFLGAKPLPAPPCPRPGKLALERRKSGIDRSAAKLGSDGEEAGSLAGDLLGAIEARLWWSRYGL